MKDYTIDKVNWNTKRGRGHVLRNAIVYSYFRSIINYLEQKNLTVTRILNPGEEINAQTQIKASHLTEQGMLLFTTSYDRWVNEVLEQKIAPDDYSLLDDALNKIRGLQLQY
ncbi:hypothetical protein [Chitinophaga sp. GbtcB8]|uniref:hypothetical protein n=1 Tax=Chitinophaga sp. GbtcB8 TaxID=2824753 RepID=UPI001C30A022|nr:hypothetical protein [Chitinophaga sp. GbtcB8]